MDTSVQYFTTTPDLFDPYDELETKASPATADAWDKQAVTIGILKDYLYSYFGTAKSFYNQKSPLSPLSVSAWVPFTDYLLEEDSPDNSGSTEYWTTVSHVAEPHELDAWLSFVKPTTLPSQSPTWILQCLLSELSDFEPDVYKTSSGNQVMEFHLPNGRISIFFLSDSIQLMSLVAGQLDNAVFPSSMSSISDICSHFQKLLQIQHPEAA
jgi:hypothetical protein